MKIENTTNKVQVAVCNKNNVMNIDGDIVILTVANIDEDGKAIGVNTSISGVATESEMNRILLSSVGSVNTHLKSLRFDSEKGQLINKRALEIAPTPTETTLDEIVDVAIDMVGDILEDMIELDSDDACDNCTSCCDEECTGCDEPQEEEIKIILVHNDEGEIDVDDVDNMMQQLVDNETIEIVVEMVQELLENDTITSADMEITELEDGKVVAYLPKLDIMVLFDDEDNCLVLSRKIDDFSKTASIIDFDVSKFEEMDDYDIFQGICKIISIQSTIESFNVEQKQEQKQPEQSEHKCSCGHC